MSELLKALSLKEEDIINEYLNEEEGPRHGKIDERPFWNLFSSQHMYVPCFQFADAPGYNEYLFTVTDCNGKEYTFNADTPCAYLTPVWDKLPEGIVEIKVYAQREGFPEVLTGARSVYKSAPFKGVGFYPEKAVGYRECALKAYRHIFNMPTTRYWLEKGEPDPYYDINVYPSKVVSRLIEAMLRYAKLEPENKEEALKIAVNAAEYLINISFKGDSPVKGLPPTYYLDFYKKPIGFSIETAPKRVNSIMMIYPAYMGVAYLELEEATKDFRYFEAAKAIADYYSENVCENGSWHLMVSVETGEPLTDNYCVDDEIFNFFNLMYKRTGEEKWQRLLDGAKNYLMESCYRPFNWEGQFEDSKISRNYSNLSHYPATAFAALVADTMACDAEMVKGAEAAVRFAEDQFVIWENFAPWNSRIDGIPKDMSKWHSPAGLEQFNWNVPIDASSANMLEGFKNAYRLTENPCWLAKAVAMANSVTNMQNEETGLIPTHWMTDTAKEDGGMFWVNCMIYAANVLYGFAEFLEKLN